MSEPTQYGKMANIEGMTPEQIEHVKRQLCRGRDMKLRELAAIDGDVFYTERVDEFPDRIEHRIFVCDSNEVEAPKQMAKQYRIGKVN